MDYEGTEDDASRRGTQVLVHDKTRRKDGRTDGASERRG